MSININDLIRIYEILLFMRGYTRKDDDLEEESFECAECAYIIKEEIKNLLERS